MATMQERIARAKKEVAEWNEKNAVGCPVWYNKAAGNREAARTTSEAKLVGFEAVIYIDQANGHRPLGKMTAVRLQK